MNINKLAMNIFIAQHPQVKRTVVEYKKEGAGCWCFIKGKKTRCLFGFLFFGRPTFGRLNLVLSSLSIALYMIV